MTQAPQKIRVSKVQALFGISRATVYRWVRKGLVKKYKVGGASFLDVAEMNALIEKGDA